MPINHNNYVSIYPFRAWVQQTLPAIYDDSLSYTDLLYKMLNYMNELVTNNNLLQEDMKKAFDYINNYFLNLDVQTNVDKKLDEMAKDGTLDKIINEDLFNNLEGNLMDLDKLTTQNSKYIAPLFFDTTYRQTEDYIKGYIQMCRKLGFGSSQMLVHIDNESIRQTTNTFVLANKYATMYNIPIKSIKFHGTATDSYINFVLSVLDYFPNLETVFVLNEQLKTAHTHTDYVVKIKTKNNKLKVGVTGDYYTCFRNQPEITEVNLTTIENNFDILGVNFYPSCSNFYSSCLNPCDVSEKINNNKISLKWSKELWCTEVGVLPYLQMLNMPSEYDLTKLTNKSPDYNAQFLFYCSCFNSNVLKNCAKICPWYIENWYDQNNKEYLDKMQNLIMGGNPNGINH